METNVTDDQTLIHEWSRIALDERLYVSGFEGQGILYCSPLIKRMAFNPAVGWAMVHSHRGLPHNLAVYVKPELRRQGQGTGLVDSLLADYIGPGCSFLPGIPGSREFFLHLFEKYSPDLVTSR